MWLVPSGVLTNECENTEDVEDEFLDGSLLVHDVRGVDSN